MRLSHFAARRGLVLAAFAASGNPNGADRLHWPHADEAPGAFIIVDAESRVARLPP